VGILEKKTAVLVFRQVCFEYLKIYGRSTLSYVKAERGHFFNTCFSFDIALDHLGAEMEGFQTCLPIFWHFAWVNLQIPPRIEIHAIKMGCPSFIPYASGGEDTPGDVASANISHIKTNPDNHGHRDLYYNDLI
jgi:hypothetical protein